VIWGYLKEYYYKASAHLNTDNTINVIISVWGICTYQHVDMLEYI